MGMYDTVTFRDPRWPELVGKSFQTKCFDCTMSDLTITETGRIVLHKWAWEATPTSELPDPKHPYIGCIRKVAGSERIIDQQHHGDVTLDGEYVARFTDGTLVRVVKMEEEPKP